MCLIVLPSVMLADDGIASPEVDVDNNLTLAVDITNFNPALTDVSWTHEGNAIVNEQDRDVTTTSSLSTAPVMATLERSTVTPLDAGSYVVTATNPAGNQSLMFGVTVKGKGSTSDEYQLLNRECILCALFIFACT